MMNITRDDILKSFVDIVSTDSMSKVSNGLDAINKVALKLGITPQYVTALFNNPTKDIINFYFEKHNQLLLSEINQNQTIFSEASLTNKIKTILAKKIELLHQDKNFIANISKYLALPQNALHFAKIAANQSDNIWKASLHNPSDFSYYTKRLSLGVIYSAIIVKFIKNSDIEDIKIFSNSMIDKYVYIMKKIFK